MELCDKFILKITVSFKLVAFLPQASFHANLFTYKPAHFKACCFLIESDAVVARCKGALKVILPHFSD